MPMPSAATLDLAAKTRFSSLPGTKRRAIQFTFVLQPLDCFAEFVIGRAFARPVADGPLFAKIASMDTAPLILLAAGGTGGHLFPAEALGVALIRRGLRVRLVTDARALRYSGVVSPVTIAGVPHGSVRGRRPWPL